GMLGDRWLDRRAKSLETCERGLLVDSHKSTEPGDVGDKDGGEATLHGAVQTVRQVVRLRQPRTTQKVTGLCELVIADYIGRLLFRSSSSRRPRLVAPSQALT